MRLGILSDTHDELVRTRLAVQLPRDAGAEALIHCGDLASPQIVEALSVMPSWFVLGNHDADMVPAHQRAAFAFGVVCLGWGDIVEVGGHRVGVVHGHMAIDVRRVLAEQPTFLLSGHTHFASDTMVDGVRRINPGALHRADEFTVAVLDLVTGRLQRLVVPNNPDTQMDFP